MILYSIALKYIVDLCVIQSEILYSIVLKDTVDLHVIQSEINECVAGGGGRGGGRDWGGWGGLGGGIEREWLRAFTHTTSQSPSSSTLLCLHSPGNVSQQTQSSRTILWGGCQGFNTSVHTGETMKWAIHQIATLNWEPKERKKGPTSSNYSIH